MRHIAASILTLVMTVLAANAAFAATATEYIIL